MPTAIDTIEEFLAQRRIALVGLSQSPRDLSRELYRELTRRGYEVVAINRRGGDVEGVPVLTSIAELPARAGEPPVDGAILMVPPSESPAIVSACAEAGIPRVWLHRGAGAGATNPEATRIAHEHHLKLVDGECPLMFIGGGVHAAHGAVRRVDGSYPLGGTRRPWLPARIALAILAILIGASALAAGTSLISDPSGDGLGMTTALLVRSPFSDFLVPGLVLFAVNGLGQLATAVLVLRWRRSAPRVAVLFGAALAAWIVGQWLWLSETSWLQPTLFAIGVAEVALAFLLVRRAQPRIGGPREAKTPAARTA